MATDFQFVPLDLGSVAQVIAETGAFVNEVHVLLADLFDSPDDERSIIMRDIVSMMHNGQGRLKELEIFIGEHCGDELSTLFEKQRFRLLRLLRLCQRCLEDRSYLEALFRPVAEEPEPAVDEHDHSSASLSFDGEDEPLESQIAEESTVFLPPPEGSLRIDVETVELTGNQELLVVDTAITSESQLTVESEAEVEVSGAEAFLLDSHAEKTESIVPADDSCHQHVVEDQVPVQSSEQARILALEQRLEQLMKLAALRNIGAPEPSPFETAPQPMSDEVEQTGVPDQGLQTESESESDTECEIVEVGAERESEVESEAEPKMESEDEFQYIDEEDDLALADLSEMVDAELEMDIDAEMQDELDNPSLGSEYTDYDLIEGPPPETDSLNREPAPSVDLGEHVLESGDEELLKDQDSSLVEPDTIIYVESLDRPLSPHEDVNDVSEELHEVEDDKEIDEPMSLEDITGGDDAPAVMLEEEPRPLYEPSKAAFAVDKLTEQLKRSQFHEETLVPEEFESENEGFGDVVLEPAGAVQSEIQPHAANLVSSPILVKEDAHGPVKQHIYLDYGTELLASYMEPNEEDVGEFQKDLNHATLRSLRVSSPPKRRNPRWVRRLLDEDLSDSDESDLESADVPDPNLFKIKLTPAEYRQVVNARKKLGLDVPRIHRKRGPLR